LPHQGELSHAKDASNEHLTRKGGSATSLKKARAVQKNERLAVGRKIKTEIPAKDLSA
jgi:hypothetical protein